MNPEPQPSSPGESPQANPSRFGAGAVIVAAGAGRRMEGVDKIGTPLWGKPLLAHTVAAFEACPEVDEVVLVVPRERLAWGQELAASYRWAKVRRICPGGERRQDSVWAGLRQLTPHHWVVIHDGARPLVTPDLIQRGLEAAQETGAAVAALPLTDTVKRAAPDLSVQETVPRTGLWAAQTPQVFAYSLLRDAYQGAVEEATDDASLVERQGGRVKLYPGAYDNIKVTTVHDLERAELFLRRRQAEIGLMRVGIGYDVHALASGRRLVLGGVEIPFSQGLAGHSDGDALCHAIIDALLGAAGLPDIGHYFPPGDPQYAGISSLVLLERTGQEVQGKGWRIANLDATVVAQQPRLAPHLAQMKEALSRALGLDAGRIGVKATTTEGLGFAGRGEGIAAYAVALLTSGGPSW